MHREHFDTMGTVASLAFASGRPDAALLSAIRGTLDGIEARFSLYRADSEISRIARGDLAMTDASPEFLDAYASAIDWKRATSDAFDPHRTDGVVDLSGIVKAQAIQSSLDLVVADGIVDALISIGGDGVVIGHADAAAKPWDVGIIDPDDRGALLCSVQLDPTRPAIATSGTAERGEHVWRHGAVDFRQVTVTASDIVTADVLATAILSGGRVTRDAVTDRWDVDVLTVDQQGVLEMSPRLRRLITQHAA